MSMSYFIYTLQTRHYVQIDQFQVVFFELSHVFCPMTIFLIEQFYRWVYVMYNHFTIKFYIFTK